MIKMIVLFKISYDCQISFLIYDSNFIVCTDRARICFKCDAKEKRKCNFENGLVEKSESSTNLR